ncbi:MAG: BMC domain-containing protein [Bacteroidales bacterium]|nr:BMC domain-containing protein [Bacteroidales bacterium]
MKVDKDTIVLGVLEFSSIAVGFHALDEMVKIAPVNIVDARTICFGKYLIVFSGDLASVEYSFKKGIETGKDYIVDSLLLPVIHQEVIGAIGNVKQSDNWGAIGIIETLNVTSSIRAADIAAKEGNVSIVEIRLANGFGGKSYVKMIGNLEDIQAAVASAKHELKKENSIFADTIIPQPEKEIKPFYFQKPQL